MASHIILQLILTFWFLLPFGISEDSGEYPRIPVTYTYESQTVQKIRTGCRGTLFPDSKETHQIFYVIDATGTMKNVETGSPIPIIFPFTTDGVMHHPHKRQLVRFDEICFPIQCNAPRCGRIVGPITSEQIPSYPATGLQGHLSANNWNLATNVNKAQTIASGLLSAGIPQKLSSVSYLDAAAAAGGVGQEAPSHATTLHKSVTNAETELSHATQKAAIVSTETHQVQSADSKIPLPVASLQTADISLKAADIGAILEPLIFQGTSTSAVNAASVENKAATSGMFPNGLGTHTESSSSSSYTYHHASPPQSQVHQTASASMASTVTSNSVIENPSLTNPIVFQIVSTSDANLQTAAANSASAPEVAPLTFQDTSTSAFSAATAKNNAAASVVVPEVSSESQAASASSSASEIHHSSQQSQVQTASSSMTLSSTDSSQKHDVLENPSPALELQKQAVSLEAAEIKEANSILSETIPESSGNGNTETSATEIHAAPEVNSVPLSVVQAETTALDTEQIIAFPMPTVVQTLTTSITNAEAGQTKPIVTENSSATSLHQTHIISVDGLQEPVQAQTTFAAASNTITVDNTQPAVPESVAQHTPITFQDSISMDAVHNQAKPQILLAPEQELVPTPTHPLHRPTTTSVTSAAHGAMTNFATTEVQSVSNSNTEMSMSQSQPAFQVQPLQNNIGFEQVTFSNGYPGVAPAPQPGAIPVTTNTVTTYTTQSNVNPSVQACPANCSPTPTQYATIAPSSLGSNPPAFASTSWPSWFPMPWLNFGRQNAAAAVASTSAEAKATIRKDANYYANLPGAIRGSTHVIYYPSCEKDAYYQPAIVNFCSYPHSAFTTYSKVTEQIM